MNFRNLNLLLVVSLFIFNQCILYDISRSASDSLGSLSTSLQSISKSFVSVSESISDSFKSDKKEKIQYQKDIQSFTEFSIKEKLTSKEYIKGINRIARKHNLVDWEKDKDTYYAIGKGLKNSKISTKEFYAFLESLSNKEVQKLIEEGYISN